MYLSCFHIIINVRKWERYHVPLLFLTAHELFYMVYTEKPENGIADKKHLPSCLLIFNIDYLHVCSSYVQTYVYGEYTYGKAPKQ